MPYADPERQREYHREYHREWRAANPERVREYRRAYRAANLERIREQDREHVRAYRAANLERIRTRNREQERGRYAAHPERGRERRRTTRHGITRAQRDALYAAQGQACAGCKEPSPDDSLQVDHDHECCPGNWSCGKCVRGLVCGSCNTRDVLAGRPPALIAQDFQEASV